MKKTLYLCCLIMLSMSMMAQIDINDKNWVKTFSDDFTTSGRSWVNWMSSPDMKWRGFNGDNVVHGIEHQVYQYANCHFNSDLGVMELVAEYDYDGIISRNEYELPGFMEGNYPIDSCGLYYFSGEIDVLQKDSVIDQDMMKFRYGYFEIRCKLPTHLGAFPAFWLQGAEQDDPNDLYYEEIDIFEYTRHLFHPNFPLCPPAAYRDTLRAFTMGMGQNLTGNIPEEFTETFARIISVVPYEDNDLNDWHIFSCEWLPNHVYWFLDGRLVNSYSDPTHIPRHHLTLRTNYAIDNYALSNSIPVWFGPGVMTIDYINAYQLKWDCQTDEVISCQQDLDNFDYGVKKSINIASSVGDTKVRNSDKVTLRATDSFAITGSFQVDSGGEFTAIMQDCPAND